MGNIILPAAPRTEDPGEVYEWRKAVEDSLDLSQRARVVTTDNTATVALNIKLVPLTVTLFEFFITARRTGGSAGTADDGAAWWGHAVYKMVAATATIIGSEVITLQGADNGSILVGITESDDTVQWQVTGDTNNDYIWSLDVRSFSAGL